ncbi:MAG: sel1 repeat family protein, partial [Deltaproteobacteria bacterium]|nr:sel1 repeat family protein [Deltaproteobacteria bacterium]
MTKRLLRCVEGHVFDATLHRVCPTCGSTALGVTAPPAETPPAGPAESVPIATPVPRPGPPWRAIGIVGAVLVAAAAAGVVVPSLRCSGALPDLFASCRAAKVAEQQRIEREKADRERAAREQAEREREAREQAERERTERERLAREQAERDRAERERLAREQAERERAERERLAREQAERERAERERLAREQAERERAERERLAREQAERERLAREQAERERAERERLAREQAERERAERERLAREQAERERIERERIERERAEAARIERERLAREQAERERVERERLERERAEVARLERERQERERERAEREKAEQERLRREAAERERAERERAEREKAERERVERERVERDKAERERAERERVEREKAERETAERDRAERERAERERAERERTERERGERQRRQSAATEFMERGKAIASFGADVNALDLSVPLRRSLLVSRIQALVAARQYDQAIAMARRVVDARDPLAAVWLGRLYLSGAGTPKNVDMGVALLRAAASEGVVAARAELGSHLLATASQDQSNAVRQTAINHLTSAAQQGNSFAREQLAKLNIDISHARPTFEELSEGLNANRPDIVEAIRDSAERNRWPIAAYMLGTIHRDGRFGFPANQAEARRWFLFAAERGVRAARQTLALCASTDTGCGTRNAAEAILWNRLALESFTQPAERREILGQIGELQRALNPTQAAAVERVVSTLGQAAREQEIRQPSDPPAEHAPLPAGLYEVLGISIETQPFLGVLEAVRAFELGERNQAIDILRRLADRNLPVASLLLFDLYSGQQGGGADPREARHFLAKALEAGMHRAQARHAIASLRERDAARRNEGLRLLELAVRGGDQEAMEYVARNNTNLRSSGPAIRELERRGSLDELAGLARQ